MNAPILQTQSCFLTVILFLLLISDTFMTHVKALAALASQPVVAVAVTKATLIALITRIIRARFLQKKMRLIKKFQLESKILV